MSPPHDAVAEQQRHLVSLGDAHDRFWTARQERDEDHAEPRTRFRRRRQHEPLEVSLRCGIGWWSPHR